MVACVATQYNFLCLHSEQRRRIDFWIAALSKASGHNYRSCLRKWYRIGTWVQVLADTDARFFCGIGGISDTIGIGTTLFLCNLWNLLAMSEWKLFLSKSSTNFKCTMKFNRINYFRGFKAKVCTKINDNDSCTSHINSFKHLFFCFQWRTWKENSYTLKYKVLVNYPFKFFFWAIKLSSVRKRQVLCCEMVVLMLTTFSSVAVYCLSVSLALLLGKTHTHTHTTY